MTGSALVGKPPANQDDFWTVRGFSRFAHLPEKKFDPKNGLPMMLKPPPGYHHETRGPGIIAAMSVAIAVVTIITGTRLCLRYFRRDLRWGWDDWMIIPGLIGVIAWFAFCIAIAADGGGGKHFWEVTYSELNRLFSLSAIGQVVFFVTVGLIKISIVLFNKRLTGLTSTRWMIAHNIFLGFLVGFIVVSLFTNLFACNPRLSHYSLVTFGKPEKPPVCVYTNQLVIALNVIHIISDFALLATPLIVLFKIQMVTSRKIRLMFLFSVGSISCIGSVMRQIIALNYQPDITWDFPRIMSWTTVDLVFGILAASLPVLNSAIPRSWHSSGNSKNPTPKINSFHSSDMPGSAPKDSSSLGNKSSQEAIHQPEFNFHSEAILHDEKDVAQVVHQPTKWNHTMGTVP